MSSAVVLQLPRTRVPAEVQRVAEPTNSDLLKAINDTNLVLAELRGEMRESNATIRGDVQRHGLEIGELRAELALLSPKVAKAVTWTSFGALLGILVPALALFTTIVLAASK